MKIYRFPFFVANLFLATALVISCSSDDSGNDPNSSSSANNSSSSVSSSSIGVSSSSVGGVSSSSNVSSSSIGGISSSSNVSSSSIGSISSSSSKLDATFHFTANKTEFLATGGKEIVYFYADNIEYEEHLDITVNIVDSNGKVVAEMKDDAKYSISGDDIMGDGVFTIKLEIDLSVGSISTYRAVAQVGSKKMVSNEITIYIITPLTPQDIENMAIVNSKCDALLKSDEYSKMTLEERSEAFLSLLTELSEQGLIIKNSITYNSGTISFKYSSGIIASIMLKEKLKEEN